MKTMKKFICLFSLLFFVLLVMAFMLFLIEPHSRNEAHALSVDEVATTQSTPILLINGSEITEDISIKQGESIIVEIEYNGEIYAPTLSADNSIASFEIIDNTFIVGLNSRLGEVLIGISYTFDDNFTYQDNVLVIVVMKESDLISIEQNEDGDKVLSLSDTVVSVNATASMQDYDGTVELSLNDGAVLEEELTMAPHGTSGLNLNYDSVNIVTENNNGNTFIQTIENNTSALNIEPLATTSLSGSGTSTSPYKIYTQEDFAIIDDYDDSTTIVYFKQMSDFTINTSFTKFHFYGCYRGNNKTITASNVSLQYSVLFRQNHGTIENLTISPNNVTITSVGYVGVVCTRNYGTINNVTIDSNYSGYGTEYFDDYQTLDAHISYSSLAMSGGICGINEENSNITNCTIDTVKFNARNSFGGMAYKNIGFIINCNSSVILTESAITDLSRFSALAGINTASGKILYLGSNFNLTTTVFVDAYTVGNSPVIGGVIGENYNTNYTDNTYSSVNSTIVIFIIGENTYYDEDDSRNLFNFTYVKELIGRHDS